MMGKFTHHQGDHQNVADDTLKFRKQEMGETIYQVSYAAARRLLLFF